MNELFKKPAGMRWVDLAIWIDKNIYLEGTDMNTVFKYMYLLAYMLAHKAKYFKTVDDYDNFAYYLAYETYSRMTNPNKIRIKSVLNYMRSIMYFRKMSYNNETFSEIIDPAFNKTWDGDKYKEISMNNLSYTNNQLLKYHIEDALKGIPHLAKNSIPRVYKPETLVYNNLYTSIILSLLSRFTLPKSNEEYIEKRKDDSTTFNDINYYRKHINDDDIILWHLPEDMESVVRVAINKVNTKLISDIREIASEYTISDEIFDSMSTDLIFGENNEGQDYS